MDSSRNPLGGHIWRPENASEGFKGKLAQEKNMHHHGTARTAVANQLPGGRAKEQARLGRLVAEAHARYQERQRAPRPEALDTHCTGPSWTGSPFQPLTVRCFRLSGRGWAADEFRKLWLRLAWWGRSQRT